ncbi:MAG: hypothetical protein FGM46_07215 [Ferruginibacter sp.]|nr:hypothetical protein [Ferruginibacter sp.]
MKKKISFLLLFLIHNLSFSQDARVSQIMNMPIVLNPANTGNFDGDFRAGVSFARLNNGSYKNNYYKALTNNIYNIGVEHKLGSKKEWAIGCNFMHSGSNNFIMSGNYTSVSLSRIFNFDTANVYSLRIGTQLSYLNGVADESRGGYSILMDVTAFQYYRPSGTDWLRKFKSEYVNINFGAVFNMNFDKFKFQTGVSAHNNFKPIFGIMYNSDRTKRIRGSLISSVTFKPNQNNSFRLDHLSWKEGLFFTYFGRMS